MNDGRPNFVFPDGDWQLTTMRFNGIPVALYRGHGNPQLIEGWVQNPRIEMVINRWRRQAQRAEDAFPDNEEMLELMLQDDDLSRSGQNTFAVKELGEDVKLNGVRDPIIVTWEGKLLDGNRRKFAAMWALSERGNPSPAHRQLLERIPVLVLAQEATEAEQQAILIQENYAESLKKAWPEVVTNGRIYKQFQTLSRDFPNDSELDIRRRLVQQYPRFNATELRNRIGTWQLTEEFRGDYADDLSEDELERLVNDRFQYFRQAHDTFRSSQAYQDPGFKELLFHGIRHGLFPSFAAVRDLDDFFASDRASEIFRQGEGMSDGQKRANFRLARDEAGRDRAERDQPVEMRLNSLVDFLDGLRSDQVSRLSSAIRSRLEEALSRLIAQAGASATSESAGTSATSES